MYKHEKMFEKNYTKACVAKLLLSDSKSGIKSFIHGMLMQWGCFIPLITVKQDLLLQSRSP